MLLLYVDVIVDYMAFYIPQATLISQSSGAVVASPRSIVVSTQGKIIHFFFEYVWYLMIQSCDASAVREHLKKGDMHQNSCM